MLRFALFVVLFFGSCGYAPLRGGAPERIAGAAILGGVASPFLAGASALRWQGVELGVFAADTAIFPGAPHSGDTRRPALAIAMSGLLAVQVAGHLLKLIDPRLAPWAYWFTSALWCYPVLPAACGGDMAPPAPREPGRDRQLWSTS